MRRDHHHHQHDLEASKPLPATPVAAVMRRDAVCVPDDLTEGALMGVLLEHDLSGAPVVDSGGFLVGYVSLADLVRERYENAETTETITVRTRGADLGNSGFHIEIVPPMVREIMSNVAVEILETAQLETAAVLMAARRLNHLPVVDRDGHVVGMLHAYDVMRWLSERPLPAQKH